MQHLHLLLDPVEPLHDVLHRHGLDPELLRSLVDQVAQIPDVLGSLQLVACQHPYLDSGLVQVRDGLRHSVLQLVLQRSGAEQQEVLLDQVFVLFELLLDGTLVLLLRLHQVLLQLLILGEPLQEEGLVQLSASQAQRSQPLEIRIRKQYVFGVLLQGVLDHVGRLFAVLCHVQPRQDDVVCPLDVEDYLRRVLILHRNAHSLPVARKRDRQQDLVLQHLLLHLHHYARVRPLQEREVEVRGSRLHQAYFIRRRSLS